MPQCVFLNIVDGLCAYYAFAAHARDPDGGPDRFDEDGIPYAENARLLFRQIAKSDSLG